MNLNLIILICLISGSNGLENAENSTQTLAASQSQTSIKLEEKIDVVPDHAGTSKSEETGFMSQLSNLIFGSSDDAEAADTQQSVQYIAPPAAKRGFQQQIDCNPCNKEPWIPIVTNYGQNAIVGFVQPHDAANLGNGGLYDHQNFPSGSYGTPSANQGFQPAPQTGYSVPASPHSPVSSPPQDFYNQPVQPVKTNYGPPTPTFHPPLADNYGPPPPLDNYGPPQSPDNYVPPQIVNSYGSPQHTNNYGSPPPENNYGPPPPSENYGPPSLQPNLDYGPAISAPSYYAPNVAAPAPAPAAGLVAGPSFGQHYGPPKPIYKIPPKNYGPPLNQVLANTGLPKPGFLIGKAPRQMRPGFHPRPHMQFVPPPPPRPNYKYIPLNKGKFASLPTNFKPPPPPTNYNPGGSINYNSFNTFVNHDTLAPNTDIKSQITNPEYLPPPDQLPIALGHNAEPIALPNLSSRPVAPLHNAQNFHDNFPQPGSHVETYESNVQIQQSIPVADFVASIEHPINIIRAPILDVSVANTSSQSDDYHTQSTVQAPIKENNYTIRPTYAPINDDGNDDDDKLSENPIVVEDTHVAAASNENKTISSFNALPSDEVEEDFIQQILNDIHGQQTLPPSTSMQPPPIGNSPWLTTNHFDSGRYVETTSTKKPKQIQIIIPYTTNNEYDKQTPFAQSEVPQHQSDAYRGSELIANHVTATPKQPTSVVNIQELFKNNNDNNYNNKNLPFDVIRLQKNIDDWTEQEYSKNIFAYRKSSTATSAATSTTKFVPSKRIPDDYLTTVPYILTETKLSSTTQRTTPKYLDHEPAGSNSKEYLQSNLIATTEQTATPKTQKLIKLPSWDKIHIAVSPLTKEKIYVVTPQPTTTSGWRQSRENDLNATFSISILPMRNKTENSKDVRVVLSEWPHLINNLATITKSPLIATTPRPTRHPLFGLMELSSYTPPANSTIETYSGHSKVINMSTASLKKRGVEEKKVTTTMKSTLK